MRQAFQAHPVVYEGGELNCTFSAGLTRHRPGSDLDESLRRADAALYDSKRAAAINLAFRRGNSFEVIPMLAGAFFPTEVLGTCPSTLA